MRPLILSALAAACLIACSPAAENKADASAAAPAPEQAMTDEEIDAASHEGPTGWLDADGAGETALLWRAGPNAIDFTFTCRQKDKALVVSAESTGTTAQPLKPATPAKVLIGAAPFSGKVSPDEGLLTMSMTVPVTKDVLAAFGTADTARIVVGDTFVETEAGGGPHMKTFAAACGALTGVAPAQ